MLNNVLYTALLLEFLGKFFILSIIVFKLIILLISLRILNTLKSLCGIITFDNIYTIGNFTECDFCIISLLLNHYLRISLTKVSICIFIVSRQGTGLTLSFSNNGSSVQPSTTASISFSCFIC